MSETKIPAEVAQISSENVRKMAEKGVSQARETYEKLNAAAKETAGSLDASASIVLKGLVEFNAKALEAFHANAHMTLDYLASLASVKAPTEIVPLQSAYAEKQFKALNDQTKDLSALAQKIAKECVEPIKGQFEKTLKSAA
ncbi:phasin family protein [Rhodoblastus acidophilus]|uniref:Phasin family protein n=1 Tax=Candidatus Rhodoblastus alkanivorans TaxID=2954117 RepID=A0ABS9Z7R3_9HYPH|nr:phasin family protein [Candidatus Rhodoblastus alkanivorans]MCI4678723.1 phasin family protein [Candidatus Rhodoblastus alkanivorans]MCI4683481.1 phasin family protein [Candidatus Rhodoblastus alkanivorans]MDI4640795.1 phasin family protein [Rhodoblastus acidophilus]